MDLTFLSATVPLTKSFLASPAGVQKTPYPNAYEVTSHVEPISTLGDIETAIKAHAIQAHCLLKGSLTRPLVKESRAGTTDPNGKTSWVCFDIDGLPASVGTIDNVMHALGLGDVSYILQWSASYKVTDNALRAHVICMLDKPEAAPQLKQWLMQLNHTIPMFESALSLTKTGNSLSWPLDISVCQNDKLIYIAPPKFKGLRDPLGKTPRISLVRKKKDVFTLPTVFPAAKLRELTTKKIEELRKLAGLPNRKTTYKIHGSIEILAKPDVCVVTEIKTERGFTYLNLNGGDSWGYYHPEDNPDFIHNFKGEPSYLTKELLPEYWGSLQGQASKGPAANTPTPTGQVKLAFLDRKTDKYFRGYYDPVTDLLDIEPTKSSLAIKHFVTAENITLFDDVIPEWDIIFDPHDAVRVDPQNRIVNTFAQTPYMRQVAKPSPKVPPTIRKVIFHMCGNDQEVFDRFINWLAYALQHRDRCITAWVFHGTTGTGKGTLLNKIIRPLFGFDQVVTPRMKDLEKQFNSFISRSLIVAVDEVETDALSNERGVMADLRIYITEPYVSLRRMYSDTAKVRNYSSWLFFSNYSAPVRVTRNDRRFNVAKYQPNKLVMTDKEIDAIELELQSFHDHLITYTVDKQKVIFPLMNQEREDLMDLTESAVDTISNALLEGNMQWLIDQLPTSTKYQSSPLLAAKVEDYKDVLKTLVERTDRSSGVCNIARDELHTIYRYNADKVPETPNKFTALLKHHRIKTTKIRIGNDTPYGIKTTWTDLKNWPQYQRLFTPQPTTQLKRVK